MTLGFTNLNKHVKITGIKILIHKIKTRAHCAQTLFSHITQIIIHDFKLRLKIFKKWAGPNL